MSPTTRRFWIVPATFVLLLMVGLGLEPRAKLFVAYADPVGVKFTGAGACAAAACHGAAVPGNAAGDHAAVIWNDKDPHSRAMLGDNGLTTDKAKAIAKKLRIEDPVASNACLVCHSTSKLTLKNPVHRQPLNAADLGNRFDAREGVSCDACHGPATKRIDAHINPGWAKKKLEEGAEKFFDDWGMLALKDMHVRANTCVTCHLRIDATVVAAGHPELTFELADFSSREWIHWRDNQPWDMARLWAVGQSVALREAAHALNDRANAAPEQKKHAYEALMGHVLQVRRIAALFDRPVLKDIDKHVALLHAQWNGPRAGWEDALLPLARIAEHLAKEMKDHRFQAQQIDELRAGLVREAEVAGTLRNFPACENLCYAIMSLNTAMMVEGGERQAPHENVTGTLFEHGSVRDDFDPVKFAKTAREFAQKLKAVETIPLPEGAPKF